MQTIRIEIIHNVWNNFISEKINTSLKNKNAKVK